MRIIVALAAILAASLAGCGQRAGNGQNVAGEAGLPTPGPRPGGGTSAGGSSDQASRQSFREISIAACLNSARTRFAQGSGGAPAPDFRPYCTCSIDRLMAGLSVEQLVRLRPGPREQGIAEQCARETGLGNAGEAGTADGGSGGK